MITCAIALLLMALKLGAQSLAALEAAAKRKPDAANMRNLAGAYESTRQFDKASVAFARASVLYAKQGDPNAAKVLSDLSKRYATSISLYVDQPLNPEFGRTTYSGAKFEPLYGCYTGVNIEREEAASSPAEFDRAIGKDQAIFFIYRSYGNSFPVALAAELKRLHAGLQLAYEPNGLRQVQDNDYLRGFARDARRSGIPVFLRFASEMNGDWTYSTYGADPVLYKQKFRLVASVMHELAPNVAMVWCPNEIPETPIPKYFPGDDAVDWVGVNFYSVLFNDGDRTRPAAWRNPADSLDTVYRLYSAKHPIMVGEWAATHKSVVDNLEQPEFARQKIGQFYAALPRLYPRVKAVNWLSMNTVRYADGPRKLNDFSLLSNPLVAEKYLDSTIGAYFLDRIDVDDVPSSPIQIVPLRQGMHVPPAARITAYVRTYETAPTVTVLQDGQAATVRNEPGEYEFRIGGQGRTTVSVVASDSRGRVSGRFSVSVVVD